MGSENGNFLLTYFLNVEAKFSLKNIFHFLNRILFDLRNIYIVNLKNSSVLLYQDFTVP